MHLLHSDIRSVRVEKIVPNKRYRQQIGLDSSKECANIRMLQFWQLYNTEN